MRLPRLIPRGRIDIPLRRLVRTLGFDLERKRPVIADVIRLREIRTVLDVGANVGQYAGRLRSWGYRGRIVSFEPLADACATLRRRAARDRSWDVVDYALGDCDAPLSINVSQASVFSSILQAREELVAAFGSAAPSGRQTIAVHRLDSVFESLRLVDGPVYLKVDTQGYERRIIRGAEQSLAHIDGVQLELSVTPMYEGETSLADMVLLMEQHGFELALLEPVAYQPATQTMLQTDAVFLRRARRVHSSAGLSRRHAFT